MLVLAHMQVVCICIFSFVLPTALQSISVGGTGAPRCPFRLHSWIFPFFDYLDSSEEEDDDNIQRKQELLGEAAEIFQSSHHSQKAITFSSRFFHLMYPRLMEALPHPHCHLK